MRSTQIALVAALLIIVQTMFFPSLLEQVAVAHATTGSMFDNVVTIMMENQGYCQVMTTCGGTGAYETTLAQQYSLAGTCSSDTSCSVGGWSAITHPSEPNYCAMLGGKVYSSCSSDGSCCWAITGPNLIDRLENSGKTWVAWGEDGTNSGTCSFTLYNGSGATSFNHFPFKYFSDMNNATRCSHFLSTASPTDTEFLNSLTTSAPNFIWLTPNYKDDGHDTGVSGGDAWLSQIVPKILSSPLFKSTTNRAALFITWDETPAGTPTYPTEFVYTSLSGSTVRTGYVGSGHYSHYSWTATVESNWGLSCLVSGNDCAATVMSEFFSAVTSSPDFTVSATSPPGVLVGQSANSTITVTGSNGFNGTVLLAYSEPSSLACGAITPGSVNGSGTATVSCSSSVAKTYALTIIGSSGSLSHSTTVSLKFQDFTISATSPSAVAPGSSATSTITVSAVNGFAGTVVLTDAVPSGLTCGSTSPTSLTGSGTATLSCSSSTQNVYTVTITGTSGTLAHATTAGFTFGTPPDFTLTVTAPATVNVGSSATSTITASSINGFTEAVALTTSPSSGLTCGPVSPSSVVGNTTATVSCSSTTAASYSLTVTGASGSLTHTKTTTLTFTDFTVSASPAALGLDTGVPGSSTITVTALDGFSGTVSLATNNPTGLSVALSTGTITGSGTSKLTVSSATPGAYSVAINATSGSLTHITTVTVNVAIHVAPVLTAPSTETVNELATLSFSVNATDSSIPSPTLTLSASQLPADARFMTVSGNSPIDSIFTWTPGETQAPGTYSVSFTATDGVLSSSGAVIVTVVDPPSVPTLSVPAGQTAAAGSRLSFTISANDPGSLGETITLSASGLVSSMSFDGSTGVFSFTPAASQVGQTFTVVFTAADSDNPLASTSQSVSIRVEGAASEPPGVICFSCMNPTHWSLPTWLLIIGMLVGIVSSIAILNMKGRTELNAAKRRVAARRTRDANRQER